MKTSMNDIIRRTLLAGIFAAVSATPALAQSPAGRWQPWVGCWSAAPAALSAAEINNAPILCVSPVANDVVEIATVSRDKIVRRDTLDASGVARAVTNSECNGTQTGRWSADNARVFVNSSLNCSGVRAVTSSILGITEEGAWLDVRRVASGDGGNVRIARYIPADVSGAVRTELGAANNDRMFASQNARIAAGAPLGLKAVVEASKLADSSVVEAWLLERAQRFRLDGKTLVELADAGVPSIVTDAMVAVSNPAQFQIARLDSRSVREKDEVSGRRVYVYAEPCGYGYSDPFFYGTSYNSYNYGRGCNYGYGYNYGSYGYGYGYGSSFGYRPVIIYNLPSSSVTYTTTGGRAVAGKGYTQTGTTSAPRPQQQTSTSSGSSSSSGSTSTSTSTSNTTENTARTAHPKP